MKTSDYEVFKSALLRANKVSANPKSLDDGDISFMFDVLSNCSIEQVLNALIHHSRKNKYSPTAHDINEIIENHTGSKHLGAEEAWAIALRSFDERLPVVLTKEILEAKATVQDIYDAGDAIGARMAFRETYNRILLTANEVNWFVTQGDDKSLTEHVVAQAVAMGRLPKGSEAKYRIEAPTTTTQALIEQAHKITGKVDALAKIGLIKSILAIEKGDGIAKREEQRLAFEAHRQSMVDKALTVQHGELH